MPFDRDAAFPRTHPWASSAPPRDRGGDFLGARAGAPSEVLYRLREWCVCISAMGTDAYALLEWDGTQRRPELRLLLSSPGRLAERGRPLDRPTLAETIESSSPRPGPTLLTGASRPMSPTTASPTSWARGACRGRQCLPVLSDADVIDPDRPGAAPRRAMSRGEGLRRARLGADGHGGSHAGPPGAPGPCPLAPLLAGRGGRRSVALLRWVLPTLVGADEDDRPAVVRELTRPTTHRGDPFLPTGAPPPGRSVPGHRGRHLAPAAGRQPGHAPRAAAAARRPCHRAQRQGPLLDMRL